MTYTFTGSQDWFSHAQTAFERWLRPMAGKPVVFLEIGSHEGRSATWMLDNVLTHPESRIYCIDPWFNAKAYMTFAHNTSPHGERIKAFRGTSALVLKAPPFRDMLFDFVYIDGDHQSYHPLEDAVLTYPLLRPGGLLCFDDYLLPTVEPQPIDRPNITQCIDSFVLCYQHCFTILHTSYQLWMSKMTHATKL